VIDYSENIERFNRGPKAEIGRRMREIEGEGSEGSSEEEKRSMLKKYLEQYLLDYEVFCFE
jgi:hypothetical protein